MNGESSSTCNQWHRDTIRELRGLMLPVVYARKGGLP